jgi:signal transduction histidine kinase
MAVPRSRSARGGGGRCVAARCRVRWWGGRFGLVSLLVDMAFVTAITWVFAFDPNTAIFVVIYVVTVEAAYRFGLHGALLATGVLALAYAARDVWAARAFDVEFFASSVSFRMGVALLIAAVAGTMSQRARREHERLQVALRSEQQAAAALRSLDELRSTFLAAVSHELRTPLTSILGFTMTVQDQADGLTDEVQEMLGHVVTESRRLERLLEDLLDIERMGRGSVSLDRHRVDIAAMARLRARELTRGTDRRIDVDAEAVVGIVDAAKVERVIDNLLGNALKYSPDSTAVHVLVERAGAGVQLCVDDDGPGVPESMRRSIFAPFERGALTSLHKPGTGIGLSLVDRFARLHGGCAWVESRSGNESGASFRVYLPDGPVGERIVTVVHEPWGAGDERDSSAGRVD